MLSTEKLTGFADEASRDIDLQIKATKELGWSAISTRMVGNANIHDMPEDDSSPPPTSSTPRASPSPNSALRSATGGKRSPPISPSPSPRSNARSRA